MKKGIDVSRWQGRINWDRVKAAGIEFAIIRAGFGKNNIDGEFERNIKECNRLNIPCGVYWFSYAYTTEMARQEARYCLDAIKPYKVEYPVVFDFEYDSVNYAKKNGVTITRTLATDIAIAFLSEIEEAGYYPMLYTNKDYMVNMFIMDRLKKYDIWYARYTSKLDRQDIAIWQYTSSGKVDGISGKVDMNISYKDYPVIIRQLGLNGLSKYDIPSRGETRENIEGGDNLKKGDKGNAVKKLQELLIDLGYSLPRYGADGHFGSETEVAVNAFKRAVKLPQNGVVDIETVLAMCEAIKSQSKSNDYEQKLQQAKSLAQKIIAL